MDSDGWWKPVVAFTDKSESFALGAEFGMIWERLKSGSFESQSVRVENRQVLEDASRHFKLKAVFTETEVDGWLIMTVERFGLTVVDN